SLGASLPHPCGRDPAYLLRNTAFWLRSGLRVLWQWLKSKPDVFTTALSAENVVSQGRAWGVFCSDYVA
ncbi:hypothetical protein, partial [Erwinia sp. ErVv1]|uniref:hypothetical protein n=1 Tax=Erwinia sp. ErVv1 TaxID=1603299 RepID=UPI001E5C8C9E